MAKIYKQEHIELIRDLRKGNFSNEDIADALFIKYDIEITPAGVASWVRKLRDVGYDLPQLKAGRKVGSKEKK